MTQSTLVKRLRIGGRYNWKNQSERLVYVGRNLSGKGRWHQFEKIGEPGRVWCEVLTEDLHMLEETLGIEGEVR